MRDYPIFLLPNGEIMMTAIIEEQKIKLLKKTFFPSGSRYAISDQGLAACIDKANNCILYGQLSIWGDFYNQATLPFPDMISPKSLCLIKNNIVLGGDQTHHGYNKSLVSYSLKYDSISIIEMPYEGRGKCIDDLLVDKNKVIAVDNIVFPKYLIEYDFSNPDFPHLINSYTLPNNGTYESIKKGTINENYIALISSSSGQFGGGTSINIFNKGTYDKYIKFSEWYDIEDFLFRKKRFSRSIRFPEINQDTKKNYYWRDIYLVPNQNILLLSADKDGIGIYFIDDKKMSQGSKEDLKSIFYFNSWDKKVKKILPVPNDNKKLIIVFEEDEKNNLNYTFALESIENIIYKFL
jgi:hypothetical protein